MTETPCKRETPCTRLELREDRRFWRKDGQPFHRKAGEVLTGKRRYEGGWICEDAAGYLVWLPDWLTARSESS